MPTESRWLYKLSAGGLVYVGSTKDPKKRRSQHLSNLRGQRHNSQAMQDAFNSSGQLPEFEVLAVGEYAYINRLEMAYMKATECVNTAHRPAPGAGAKPGHRHSEETKKRMSKARTEYWQKRRSNGNTQ